MPTDTTFADTYDHVLDVEGRGVPITMTAEEEAHDRLHATKWVSSQTGALRRAHIEIDALRVEVARLRPLTVCCESNGHVSDGVAVHDEDCPFTPTIRRAESAERLVALQAKVIEAADAMRAQYGEGTMRPSTTLANYDTRRAALSSAGGSILGDLLADLQAPPSGRCQGCGRCCWGADCFGTPCGMPQPSGERCQGRFERFAR